jgi:hypothetical protein
MIASLLLAAALLGPTTAHVKADEAQCQATYIQLFDNGIDTAEMETRDIENPRLAALKAREHRLLLQYEACDAILSSELRAWFSAHGFAPDTAPTPAPSDS